MRATWVLLAASLLLASLSVAAARPLGDPDGSIFVTRGASMSTQEADAQAQCQAQMQRAVDALRQVGEPQGAGFECNIHCSALQATQAGVRIDQAPRCVVMFEQRASSVEPVVDQTIADQAAVLATQPYVPWWVEMGRGF